MATNTIKVAAGDDLFRLAAELYRDAAAWTLLARANGMTDPLIKTDITLVIPAYSRVRANDGILASS